MIARRLARLAGMDRTEIGWRTRAQARMCIDRVRSAASAPRWDRGALAPALADRPALASARAALNAERWSDAHEELTRHFAASPSRFVVSAANRSRVAERIREAFPDAERAAGDRGDRIAAGNYDLLGYAALRFDRGGDLPDWHYDPVHQRSAPRRFWATVPYLDPACGDHKVIWELNRHQHWLALGRAYWLTGATRYRERYVRELASWLDDNPPLIGINWASMLELALRSLSWLWALHLFVDPEQPDEVPWTVDLLLGLDRQLTHVERNLSYYFSPNTHLLGEALALYVAGRSLPELAASPRREALGRRVLIEEIPRQIAADGGHCERSTHYQRYTLDFYSLALAIARITRDPAAGDFEDAVIRLGIATRSLADDAGRVPLLGDDDGGALWRMVGEPTDDVRGSLTVAGALAGHPDLAIGPAPEEAYWVLGHPALGSVIQQFDRTPTAAPPSVALAETGYYISRSASGDHLVIDGGPHGYQNGGHAHADALAMTFTNRGIPMLVDAGTGCYTVDRELRDRMRSTALHNTLLLDGESQSIPSGPFHWTRKADGRMLRWRTDPAFDYFAGSHNGYAPSEHRRHVLVLHGDLLVVADLVIGARPHTAAVHWHVGSRWTVRVNDRTAHLTAPGNECQLMIPAGTLETFSGDRDTGLGWHAPVYGRLEASTTLRVTRRGDVPFWIVSVFGLDDRNRLADVQFMDIDAASGVLSHGMGLRIVREQSIDDLLIAERTNPTVPATWRLGEIETDAHLLFSRVRSGQRVKIALVDGSLIRTCGGESHLALAHAIPKLHLDNLCAA